MLGIFISSFIGAKFIFFTPLYIVGGFGSWYLMGFIMRPTQIDPWITFGFPLASWWIFYYRTKWSICVWYLGVVIVGCCPMKQLCEGPQIKCYNGVLVFREKTIESLIQSKYVWVYGHNYKLGIIVFLFLYSSMVFQRCKSLYLSGNSFG